MAAALKQFASKNVKEKGPFCKFGTFKRRLQAAEFARREAAAVEANRTQRRLRSHKVGHVSLVACMSRPRTNRAEHLEGAARFVAWQQQQQQQQRRRRQQQQQQQQQQQRRRQLEKAAAPCRSTRSSIAGGRPTTGATPSPLRKPVAAARTVDSTTSALPRFETVRAREATVARLSRGLPAPKTQGRVAWLAAKIDNELRLRQGVMPEFQAMSQVEQALRCLRPEVAVVEARCAIAAALNQDQPAQGVTLPKLSLLFGAGRTHVRSHPD
jgi:hypothetical protein